MSTEPQSAGDAPPPNCELIEVHVAELKQPFKAIDPSPFREKNLDADAEDFIVGWAKDVSLRSVEVGLAGSLDEGATGTGHRFK